MDGPSDEELERVALAIRAHRRRSRLAITVAVGTAFATWLLPFGFLVWLVGRDSDLHGRLFWMTLALGVIGGAGVYRWLSPRRDPYWDDD